MCRKTCVLNRPSLERDSNAGKEDHILNDTMADIEQSTLIPKTRRTTNPLKSNDFKGFVLLEVPGGLFHDPHWACRRVTDQIKSLRRFVSFLVHRFTNARRLTALP